MFFLFILVSLSSVAQSCPTLCDPMDCSTPGFPVHHQLPQPARTHVHQVGDAIQHLILCRLLLLLPSIFPRIRVFFNESVLHIRWPKYCSFSFSITASYEYSGLVSFRVSFPFQVLQSFPIISVLLICSLTVVWEQTLWFPLLRCVIKRGSSWWTFHESLRRIYTVLLLDEGVHKCQSDPADRSYYLV